VSPPAALSPDEALLLASVYAVRQHQRQLSPQIAESQEKAIMSSTNQFPQGYPLLPTPRALDASGVRGRTPNRTDEANARAGESLTDVLAALMCPWYEVCHVAPPKPRSVKRCGKEVVVVFAWPMKVGPIRGRVCATGVVARPLG
jgi:hypothetical protein